MEVSLWEHLQGRINSHALTPKICCLKNLLLLGSSSPNLKFSSPVQLGKGQTGKGFTLAKAASKHPGAPFQVLVLAGWSCSAGLDQAAEPPAQDWPVFPSLLLQHSHLGQEFTPDWPQVIVEGLILLGHNLPTNTLGTSKAHTSWKRFNLN